MPDLNFSAPNLAIVAYAEVDGATGTSSRLNSGIVTSRTPGPFGAGQYLIFLPTNLGQFEARDIIIVQAKNNAGGGGIVAKDFMIEDGPTDFKVVNFYDGALAGGATPPLTMTRIDSTFFILILRTTISPPGISPA